MTDLSRVVNGTVPGRIITRAQVIEIEKEILRLPQVKPRLVSYFLPGLYIRELHLSAGMVTTGAIHKFATLNILSIGKRLTLINDHIEYVEAPHIHLAPPGMKRLSYTIEDSVWITLHPTIGSGMENERNNDKWEQYLTCRTEEEYQQFVKGNAA